MIPVTDLTVTEMTRQQGASAQPARTRVGHAQRVQQPLGEQHRIILPGGALQDEPEKLVAEVGVEVAMVRDDRLAESFLDELGGEPGKGIDRVGLPQIEVRRYPRKTG